MVAMRRLPRAHPRWYLRRMSGTHSFTVGDRGRVVLPVELRQNRGWPEGTTLIAVETERGVIVATRSELETIVADQLAGSDPVDALLSERRAAAIVENG